MKNTKKKNEIYPSKLEQNRGYALLETIFYILLFAILSIAVIDALMTMTKSFKETAIESDLMQGGNIMERMTREIRQANGISAIGATDLKLNTKDNAGAAKTVEFLLAGSDIQFLENNAITGNLNSSNISVTNLSFAQINTVKGAGVKITLSVKSNNDPVARNENFYDTIVLRGDYQ